MSKYTPTCMTPNWAGEFSNFQQWVNKGRSWLDSPDHRRAVCIDDKGRRVTCGADFMLARDEGAFPVRFFWDCEPQVAAPSAASAAPADERAKFEAWAKSEDGGHWEWDDELFEIEGGQYKHVGVRNDWKAWQAAIAASSAKPALTDDEIIALYLEFDTWPERKAVGEILLKFARSIAAASGPNVGLVEALNKIISMNRQHAEDQYGDAEKAESWSCIVVARAALAAAGVKE